MAKRKRKKTAASGKKGVNRLAFLKNERVHFLTGVVIAFIGIFLLLAIISFFFTGAADQSKVLNLSFFELVRSDNADVDNWTGAGGAFLAEMLVNGWFGIFSAMIPLFLILSGLRIMKVSDLPFMKALFITAFGLISGSIASAFILGNLFPNSHINWGGAHGTAIEQLLENSIGWPGVVLLILLFLLTLIVVLRKRAIYAIQKGLANSKPSLVQEEPEETFPVEEAFGEPLTAKQPGVLRRLFGRLKWKLTSDPGGDQENHSLDGMSHENNEDPTVPLTFTEEPKMQQTPLQAGAVQQGGFEVVIPEDDETSPPVTGDLYADPGQDQEPATGLLEDYDPRRDLSSYRFPTMNLLKVYNTSDRAVDMKEQNDNKEKIIHTLRNYGIEITSIKATVGPTITLYEIVPQAGVRISKIRNLEDDIALSLSALGIRIIAPMPGKGTIGIEVPNKDPQIVSMQSVISSRRFQECDYDLPVALGKTITNEVFIFDLTKMPHLLVAGATGQGKSVGLNAIITSLLYKKHPSEMKMVLIDPKMVEFNIYSTIEKHYLAKLPDEEKAIITDVKKVTQTLNSLTKEMDDRYELLMRAHVRTIREYNEKFIKRRLHPEKGHRYLPYIVVVIDEFGDLIMTAGKEIEMPIARIAQKARAVGIHMVIATQRPTTNIITGTIKANFPARMAFRVTSQIDSRTILDMSGANQLIGRGDMLFSQGSSLIRIQCAFVDTPEVEEITQYIGKQNGYDQAFALPEVASEAEETPGAVDLNDRDPLFEEAARLIVVHQQGSTSLIQRKFSIGYNRAGRLMDQLEAAGIVGATQGSKPRDVFVADEYSLEKLLNSLR